MGNQIKITPEKSFDDDETIERPSSIFCSKKVSVSVFQKNIVGIAVIATAGSLKRPRMAFIASRIRKLGKPLIILRAFQYFSSG